jgi:acyl transferase domain-containing protein
MAGRFADCDDVAEFWANLKSGRESVGVNARFDAAAAARGNGHMVEQVKLDDRSERFDPALFGMSPREADRLEPQQRAFLELAWEAMEDGGYSIDVAGPNVGVFGGANFTSYFELAPDARLPDALDEMIGADKDYLATRVAHHLGLRGPALTVQTACSTSLVAVHLACQSLLLEECDAALAGGVSITRPRLTKYNYVPGGILSPDGFCRAFDADAMGTVFTEGAGVVLLMRLEDALARRHPIYAVIRGSAVNNDGGGKASYMAPSIAGQERVIRAAMKAAAVTPPDLGFIEAHGSATVLGDAIELAALSRVFRGQTDGVGVCHLGSVKTNVGHTASASGVAGLMKAALALRHELIPANVNFQKPNPDLDLTVSPFTVSGEAQAWPRRRGAPRFAGVSSFGVGGTNAHAILQEAPKRPVSRARRHAYVLTLSARSEAALAASAEALRRRLRGASRRELADVAYTLNVGRRALECRAAIVCGDVREAREALAGRAQSTAVGGRIASGERVVGFMFPGQGAQHLGMGRQLYQQEPIFRGIVDRCLAHLSSRHGIDLGPLFRGNDTCAFTDADIAQTGVAQPLLFVFEYALSALMTAWGVKPSYAIGHSIGEYAAACLAGVFSLEDGLDLVALRGRLMQALPPGAMLSVAALPDAFELPADLDVAAVNSPRQSVVSGAAEAIDAFAAKLEAEQIHSNRLRTSHAFHSRLMEPMLAEFRDAVSKVAMRPPSFPLVSNVTGGVVLWETLRNPDYWVQHIREPVLFAQGLDTLVRRGVDLLVEVGPGRLLSGLAQQNGVHRQHVRIVNTIHNDGAASDEVAMLTRALARIWLEGGPVDWAATHRAEKRRMVPLPRYPFEHQTFRTEPTAGRPAQNRGKLKPPEWLYLPTWRRTALIGASPALAEEECWLVFENDDAGVGAPGRLASEIAKHGERVVRLRPGETFERLGKDLFRIDPSATSDLALAFEALKAEGVLPRRVVHAWNLTAPDDDDLAVREPRARFDRRQACGVASLARCLKAYHDVFGRSSVAFEIVTSGAAEVSGSEILRPGAASAIAFGRVAPQENAHVITRVLDIDPALLDGKQSGPVFARIADALRSPIADRMVALRDRFWWAQDVERLPPRPTETCSGLKRGGVYQITGGMGYIGLIFARHLAEVWDARLVLVGRSPLGEPAAPTEEDPDPAPSRADHLAALNALGGEAIYVQADVSCEGDMLRLRETIYERFGALNGIIFGAGTVEARGAIDEIDETPLFEDNFLGKAHGLGVALDVFGADPIDFGIVLSSISTALGGLGLCAYSGANHVADLILLRHRRGGHTNWTATNWDLWGDGHFVETDRRFSIFRGLAIEEDEGVEALEHVLNLPPQPQVIVSTHDVQGRIDLWVTGVALANAASQTQHKRPNLVSEYAEVEGELEQRIHDVWSQVLGIETIGRDDDFFEMGGHSILAVRISVQIQEFMPPDAPAPNLYDTPTIRLLAEVLGQAQPAAAG